MEEEKKDEKKTGSGNNSVVQCPTRDRKVAGSNPGRGDGRNFLVQGQLHVLTLILVFVSPRVTAAERQNILVILPKVQMADYS